MPRLLLGINVIMGFLLFFLLSQITSFNHFGTSAARVIVFIVAAMLIWNTVYLAFGSESGWYRRRQ